MNEKLSRAEDERPVKGKTPWQKMLESISRSDQPTVATSEKKPIDNSSIDQSQSKCDIMAPELLVDDSILSAANSVSKSTIKKSSIEEEKKQPAQK